MNAQDNPSVPQELNDQQRHLMGISALTASGKLESLKVELNNALDAGLTINEIKEALVQLYAYCGFPRSLNAINAFMSVTDHRKSLGLKDTEGKRIVVENNVPDKYEQGRRVLEELTKTPQSRPAPGFGEFAPRVDAFLKEHLFADIFASDVLTFQQRELVTISALTSMPGVEPQLKSHITFGKNTGITEDQLKEIAHVVEKHVSKTQANTLRKLIGQPSTLIAEQDMIVRISEIEILPDYLTDYNTILKEEAAASVKVEPGVLAIFPMSQKENPTQIRIVEIYANRAAYQSHLQTPHFIHYKTATSNMVKSLKLIDMNSLDPTIMVEIFKKME